MKIAHTRTGICISTCLVTIVMTLTNIAQPIGPPPTGGVKITDRQPVGQPERVDAGDGKYKKIYRNRAGQIIREETYEGGGGMLAPDKLLETRHIRSVHPNGAPAHIEVQQFKDNPDPNIIGPRQIGSVETITYNEAGEPTEQIKYPACGSAVNFQGGVRIYTVWEAGTKRSVVRIQRFDATSKSWTDLPYQPNQPASTGPGPTSASTKLPSGTTATAQTRVRANGQNSLLLSFTSPQPLDNIQISFTDSKPLTAGFLPDNWTMTQDGKKVTFTPKDGLKITHVRVASAPSINIRLDLQNRITAPQILVEASSGGKTQFETRLTPETLPPVTNVADLTNALNLPPEIVPGKEFLATPKPGFTKGVWRIANGPVGQWINTGDPNYRPVVFKVTENESPRPKDRVFINYQYYDQYGELLLDREHASLRTTENSASRYTEASPKLDGQRFAFAGQTTCARGVNTGSWEDYFFYTLDGTTPLLPVSASPTTVTLAIPGIIAPGPHTIGSACPTPAQHTINILGVEGSIDTNMLWTGGSTTMRLKVIGTEEILPVGIRNNTPAIISMADGTANSSGGPNNIVTRSVTGKMRGNFQIDYWLDYPVCGGGR